LLTASSLALDLGAKAVGSASAAASVQVTNIGNSAVTFYPTSITGANATNFSISQSTCGDTLGAGSVCSVSVTFTPSTFGVATASLQINSTAQGSPLTVDLTGIGN
jgi:hypothetical protein